MLAQCRTCGNSLIIGGDRSADSPRHSAKYGSYRLIDLTSNKVIHLELVQVCNLLSHLMVLCRANVVQCCNHMEKVGLKNAIQFLAEQSINISTLIIDRHKQISKFVSQNYTDIDHCFDI